MVDSEGRNRSPLEAEKSGNHFRLNPAVAVFGSHKKKMFDMIITGYY